MKKATPLMLVGILCLCTLLGCSSLGKRLDFKNSQVYYTSNVTEDEAKGYGNYLVQTGLITDNGKMNTQLDKSGDTYIAKFVALNGVENNDEFIAAMKKLEQGLSKDVFHSGKVEIRLCDNKWNTLKAVKMDGEATHD